MFLNDEDLKAYEKSKELGLEDSMPIGKFKGVKIEDYIQANPWSVTWYIENGIIVLNDEAHEALNSELQDREDARQDMGFCSQDFDPSFNRDLPF